MPKVLLLYDTKEEDLARDCSDFLHELGLDMVMIPLSPDKGKTLQEKERHYFDNADGAVFLVTCGSKRDGRDYPSPSVAEEMGLAKGAFSKTPERLIFLVDTQCTIQAVSQNAYIPFVRDNTRSTVKALTQTVRDLKDAGLFGMEKGGAKAAPQKTIAEIAEKVEPRYKAICYALSGLPDARMKSDLFEMMLKSTFKMNERAVNFAKVDLPRIGLAVYQRPALAGMPGIWQLLPLGLEIVRYESKVEAELKWKATPKGGLTGQPAISKGFVGEPAMDLARSLRDKEKK